MTRRPSPLARRLHTVEKQREDRLMVHPYRLTDGSTVRLSTHDVLGALGDGLRMHGRHVTDPPPDIVRTLAQVDPDDKPSMLDRLIRGVAVKWCAAHDEDRVMILHSGQDQDEGQDDETGPETSE